MAPMSRATFAFLSALLLSCMPLESAPERPQIAPTSLTLVESEPSETTLDRPDLANAPDTWRNLFQNAKRTIDMANFYASEADPQWLPSSKLTPLIEALTEARKRGVKVRILLDEKFIPQYRSTLERLESGGLEIRRIDGDSVFGGVQHAKYFVVDGAKSFVGSQNFDWRALDHIQEMGVQVDSTALSKLLLEIFETDWAIAGGAERTIRMQDKSFVGPLPTIDGQQVELVASPKNWLPREESWELPRIIHLIDGAKQSVLVQVLKYKTVNRAGNQFLEIDSALRRASARGVKVRLLVSEWALKDSDMLKDLASVIEIGVIKIPAWSGGEIPFARVAHAKYMVVDGQAAWVGSSNWEGDYFLKSRNVGVIISGGGKIPARLATFFEENWKSSYVAPLTSLIPATNARQ